MATQVLVIWTYPFSDNTGFLLQRSVNSGSSWNVNVSTTASVTQYTDSDVIVDGTYWYKVAATNAYGTGSFSNTASIHLTSDGPVTLSLTVMATSETKSFDGTTSSFQTPIITSGSFAIGDTGSFIQYFDNKLIASDIPVNPTGSLSITSGNAYDITLIPNVGTITGPTASVNSYIVIPVDTDLPVDDGWFLDIQNMAKSSSYFMIREFLPATNVTLTLTSSNCVNWDVVSSTSESIFCRSYAFGNGRVIGIDTNYNVQYSDDFGITWASSSIPGLNQQIYDVIYDGTKFVAVGKSATVLTSSTDGIDWYISTTSGSEDVRRIIYNSSSYIAVGPVQIGGWPSVTSSGTIYTSSDLITWNAVSSSVPTIAGYEDITYNSNIYLAVGENGLMATSSNGLDWGDVSQPSPIYDTYLTSVTWDTSSGLFAVSDTNGYVFSSPDAITWTLDNLTPNYLYSGSFYYNVVRMDYQSNINKVVIFGTAPPT